MRNCLGDKSLAYLLYNKVLRKDGINVVEEDVLEFLVTAIRLIEPFELCMFSLKPLEEGLNGSQLLRIRLWRARLHASIQQDVRLPMLLVVTVGIHKFIFGPRLKVLTCFLVRDRSSHPLPKHTDKEVGTARLHHMTIDDGL